MVTITLTMLVTTLATQVGEHIHKEPSEQLSSRLFYL